MQPRSSQLGERNLSVLVFECVNKSDFKYISPIIEQIEQAKKIPKINILHNRQATLDLDPLPKPRLISYTKT
jgi:hypothetical protein